MKYLGCIHLLNTCKYCDNTRKYCGNTYKYVLCQYLKMCSPASVILVSIVIILVSFEAIKIHQNCFKSYKCYDNTCEYCTCRTQVNTFFKYWLNTTIPTSIFTIFASIEQVNTPLEVKHPPTLFGIHA